MQQQHRLDHLIWLFLAVPAANTTRWSSRHALGTQNNLQMSTNQHHQALQRRYCFLINLPPNAQQQRTCGT